MKVFRLAGVLLFCLSIGWSATAPALHAAGVDEGSGKPIQEAPLFRVFLKDGTTLVSYGELARVGDRVVFSMPTSASRRTCRNSISSILRPTVWTGCARRTTPSRREPRRYLADARRNRLHAAHHRNRAGAQRRRADDRSRQASRDCRARAQKARRLAAAATTTTSSPTSVRCSACSMK